LPAPHWQGVSGLCLLRQGGDIHSHAMKEATSLSCERWPLLLSPGSDLPAESVKPRETVAG